MIPHSRRSFFDRTRMILAPACAMLVAFASSPAWSHGGGFHGGGGGGFHGGGGSFHGGGGYGGGMARPSGGMSRPTGSMSRPTGGMSRPAGGASRPAGGTGSFGKAGGGAKTMGGHFAGDPLAHSSLSASSLRSLGRGGASTNLKAHSIQNLNARGSEIRNNFYNGNWYGGRGWYANNFGRWWPGGWYGGWGGWGIGLASGLLWADLAGWGGYGAPIAYDYGTTVVYGDDGVTVAGENMGTPEEYSQSATDLAESGSGADAASDDSQWRPLGVYALARDGESKPSTFISLAVDADGVLRGNYYDAISDSSKEITGKVDSQTQRAAWTIGDNKANVYEAGLSNLLKDQTQVLVHRNNEDGSVTGDVEQMLLVRVDDGDDKTS